MVMNQVVNLISNLFWPKLLAHNSNGECKFTFDIYVSKNFQWHIGGPIWIFYLLHFCAKNHGLHRNLIPQVKNSFGNIGTHFPTLVGVCLSPL